MQDREHRRPTVGVLVGAQVYYGTILGNFIGPVLRGVRSAAHDRDCNLLLACGISYSVFSARPAWPVPSPGSDFVPVGPWNTDGLIVVTPLLSETRSRYIQSLIAAGHPIVFIATGERGLTVAVDNEGGIRQALAHLVGHGHRCIAFIAGQPEDMSGDSGVRLRTYLAAGREYGLAADHDLIAYGFHGIEGGQRAMQQILDSGVSFTAVLASNDESAIGAMTALRGAGLRIPQDAAIVGFDDTFEASAQVPPLTTVRSSPFEMGYRALELLLEHIERRREGVEIIRVPTRLVIRRSCGCRPDDVIPFVLDVAARPGSRPDQIAVQSQIAQAMAETVLAEAQRLSVDEVHVLCRRLVEAFALSLERGEATNFRLVLEQVLQRVETVEDDAHVWQAAVSALEGGIASLLEAGRWPTTRQQAADMLRQARIAISESVRRQYRRYVAGQRWAADRMGLLADRLLTALDETQIFEILAEHLPQMGIQHAGVAFFELEGDDPVAWSLLRMIPDREGMPFRFPSRQFPPEGLYPEDKPFSLAVLTLASQEGVPGFVAFDATGLELCATIVWQLITVLRVVRLYREATEGRRLAEEANRLKSRFLSTVSHELRTPLSLIVGLSEMLLKESGGGSEAYWRDLKRIHASAQHLDGLIRDVLDLARSEVGQLKLVCAPLDLAEVLQVVVVVGEQMARDKGLDWRVEIPEGLPRVWGDRTRLWQIALNLVGNAVKFTARGEVALRVEVNEETVSVVVGDTGLGIPVEEQEVIFDEFRQSERTTARGYGGLGLGLAICRGLIELHGGEIGVRSSGEEGAGSTFYFTLPVIKDLPCLDEEERVKSLAPGQTVLLLADRFDGGECLREHLTRHGFDVQVLGVDKVTDWLSRRQMSPPGAVVLDIGIASERGWEILEVLKENLLAQDVPVLFYSLAREQNTGSMLALDYLAKPTGTAELTQALERQGLAAGEGKTVLIVDDEPGVLGMHARIVEAWSPECRVLKALNGREALEMIRQKRPDLVLLDLMMPELDGFGVLEAMQEGLTTCNIPVIVLTQRTLTEEDMARLNNGVASVLSKGVFSGKETLAHIEAALAQNKRLGSGTQRLVRKAMAYLHEHCSESVSLETAARYVGMDKSYLARCFRREMGVTLGTYLNRYRVNQAKALLEVDGKSVTEVAMEVGFSSGAYFSRVFRREVGMPPSKYRQSHASDE
jgi:signal transduction histidine kinase/DNA-binding LacI/PurR family transcriptional regulator/DNA-binding response OmpR family regulator